MLEQYTRINQAAGISLYLGQDGMVKISGCSLIAKGNQLDFTEKLSEVSAWDDLRKKLPTKVPVALNLSGKGVLIKQVSKLEEVTAANFSVVLPNANFEDFYVQHFISGERSFVALVRKAEADKWITGVNESGWSCLALSLGPFPVQHILPQLNEYGQEVVFSGHRIQRDEQHQWLNYNYHTEFKAPFPLKLAGEKLDERLVLPYAAAFQLVLFSRLEPIQAAVPELESALEQKLSIGKLKARGMWVLGIFFALLLVNFVLFSYYSAANERLARQVSRSAQSTTDLEKLTEGINRKAAVLQTLGWERGITKSSLIDQLAQCLPPDIGWQNVAVNPIRMASGSQQASFESRLIRITGTCPRIVQVNEWLARIKSKHWVRRAELEDYTFNNELNTGVFTLTVNY